VVGGHHGECGARTYNGGLGAEPPAGSRGKAPLKLRAFWSLDVQTDPANLAPVRENSMFCYGPLVSELGGPECMVPPNPDIRGPVPPPPAPPMYSLLLCEII